MSLRVEILNCIRYLVVRLHDLGAHAAQRALQAADRGRDALQRRLRLAQAAGLVKQGVMARRHLRPQPAFEDPHALLRGTAALSTSVQRIDARFLVGPSGLEMVGDHEWGKGVVAPAAAPPVPSQ